VVSARAAQAAGIPMVMSAASLFPLEEVVAYLAASADGIDEHLDRIGRAGFRTLVVTVETAVRPNLEAYARAGFHSALRP
jgi:L-lactate dehydrogenase (cytochrome)